MSTRSFFDSEGCFWQAWDVVPAEHSDWPETARRHLPASMAEGWLCFESESSKRRVHPIPRQWEKWSVDELRIRCRQAEAVPRRSTEEIMPPPEVLVIEAR